MANSSLDRLRRAMDLALAGDHQQARELCASVMFEVQPVLGRRRLLLRTLLCALLVSHGFKLASRLVATLGGWPARFVLQPCGEGSVAAPRCADGSVHLIDPRWLAQLSPEDPFIRELCQELAGTRSVVVHAMTAAQRAPLSPTPA